MQAVEWQRETPPHPPLLSLTAADHQYHRKAKKPRLAYRWYRLSIVFIAAVSTAAGGSFDLLSHHLCRVLGIRTWTCRCCLGFSIPRGLPAPCFWPPMTGVQLRISSRDHQCEYRQTWHHYELTRWFLGAQEINAWSDYGTNRGFALSCDSIPLTILTVCIRSLITWLLGHHRPAIFAYQTEDNEVLGFRAPSCLMLPYIYSRWVA